MTASLPPLPPLAPELMHIGADPRLLRHEIETWLVSAAANAPRSRQRAIGPSELGTPCVRRLAYRLAGVEAVNVRDGWRPTVGTAVHAWIADALMLANQQLRFTRYLIENRVHVGDVGGAPVFGSADAYDRVTAEVIDWKIVGPTTLKDARRNGMKPGYRVQAHLYGRGFIRRGVPVTAVNIAYLPSNGEMSEAVWCRETYDDAIATDAIERANAIAIGVSVLGAEPVIRASAMTSDHCLYCPFFNPVGSGGLEGCPSANTKKGKSLAETLIDG